MEDFKVKLNIFFESLPCISCSTHSVNALLLNKILNSVSFLHIFHFILELRNVFYKPIDRKLFKTMSDIKKNKNILLINIINPN